MKARKTYQRFRNEGGQARDENQRPQDHMYGAVAVRCFEWYRTLPRRVSDGRSLAIAGLEI